MKDKVINKKNKIYNTSFVLQFCFKIKYIFMKKKSFKSLSLLLVLLSFFASCIHHQEPPSPPPQSNPENPDFAALVEVLYASMESGLGEICPECAGAAALVSSALASGEAHREYYSENSSKCDHLLNKTIETINLPKQYLLKENVFEIYGQKHNYFTFLLQNNKSNYQERLNNGDYSVFFDLDNEFQNSNIASGRLSTYCCTISFLTARYKETIDKYKTKSTFQNNKNFIINSEIFKKPEFSDIKLFILSLNSETKSVYEKINLINTQIIAYIHSNDSLKNIKIKGLTVLKHSLYYWSL